MGIHIRINQPITILQIYYAIMRLGNMFKHVPHMPCGDGYIRTANHSPVNLLRHKHARVCTNERPNHRPLNLLRHNEAGEHVQTCTPHALRRWLHANEQPITVLEIYYVINTPEYVHTNGQSQSCKSITPSY